MCRPPQTILSKLTHPRKAALIKKRRSWGRNHAVVSWLVDLPDPTEQKLSLYFNINMTTAKNIRELKNYSLGTFFQNTNSVPFHL